MQRHAPGGEHEDADQHDIHAELVVADARKTPVFRERLWSMKANNYSSLTEVAEVLRWRYGRQLVVKGSDQQKVVKLPAELGV